MKFTYVNKEAKSIFKRFSILSLGILIFALGSIIYHGITKPNVFPASDLILVLFGMVSFTLGTAFANRCEIEDLKRRFNQ